ncbi:MAG: hypothetical protein QNL12_00625 [Acidimicrobiia bacterium]|nr:hypothetical protein [Acidimicrobiia bacterium]MDX2465790.1 hypothetical protein [Acidimicrobiia bacterium]
MGQEYTRVNYPDVVPLELAFCCCAGGCALGITKGDFPAGDFLLVAE